jgi:hypothetical protein
MIWLTPENASLEDSTIVPIMGLPPKDLATMMTRTTKRRTTSNEQEEEPAVIRDPDE